MFENKNKKIIAKISKRSIKNNRIRNIFAMFAILLTTILMTTVFTCGVSFYKTYDFYGKMGKGVDYHGYINGDFEQYKKLKNHDDVKKAGILCDMSTSYIRSKQVSGKRIYLKYADQSLFEMNYVKPVEGEYPKTSNDILVPTFLLDLFSMPYKTNQKITFNIPIIKEGKEIITPITFNICGYYESVIPSTSNYGEVYTGYDFIEKYNSKLPKGLNKIYIQTKSLNNFSSSKKATEALNKIQQGVGGTSSSISPDFKNMSDSRTKDLLAIGTPVICVVLLIVICGYFLIYNIFDISVINDIKFYGLLKTVGATQKQIKKLLKKQVVILSIISIPIGLVIGYFMGIKFAPGIIEMTKFGNFVQLSKNPFVFVISALFAFLTVFISCRKPMKKASKISPVEAVKYEGEVGRKRAKSNKRTRKNNVYRMGFKNILRNKRKTAITVISVSLASIIFIVVCNVTIGYDEYKLSNRYNQSDIKLYHHTSVWTQEVPYEPIDYNLYERIKKMDIVKEANIYYMGRTKPDYMYQEADNQKLYFSQSEFKNEGLLKKEIDSIIKANGGKNNGEINEKGNILINTLGIPAENIETETSNCKILNGKIDKEKFATGNYIIFQSPNKFYGQGEKGGKLIKAGDKINLSFYDYARDKFIDKEFNIMAVIDSRDMFNKYNIRGINNVILSNECFKQIYSNYKEQIAAMEIYTKDHLSKKDVDKIKKLIASTGNFQIEMNSKYEHLQQFSEQKKSITIIGYSFSSIIGLIGIFNMINTLVTSILMRRVELASFQSIGTTKKQLKKMLVAEGSSLSILSFAVIAPISFVLSIVITENPMFSGFNVGVFFISLIGICLALFVLSILIATIMIKFITKQSIVERLRITE